MKVRNIFIIIGLLLTTCRSQAEIHSVRELLASDEIYKYTCEELREQLKYHTKKSTQDISKEILATYTFFPTHYKPTTLINCQKKIAIVRSINEKKCAIIHKDEHNPHLYDKQNRTEYISSDGSYYAYREKYVKYNDHLVVVNSKSGESKTFSTYGFADPFPQACLSDEGTVFIIDEHNSKLLKIKCYSREKTLCHIKDTTLYQATKFAISPGGKLLAAATKSQQAIKKTPWVALYNVKNNSKASEIICNNKQKITELTLSKHHHFLAVQFSDHTIELYDTSNPETPELLWNTNKYSNPIYTLAFSWDNAFLAAITNEKIEIRNAQTGQLLSSLPYDKIKYFNKDTVSLCFSPDNNVIAAYSEPLWAMNYINQRCFEPLILDIWHKENFLALDDYSLDMIILMLKLSKDNTLQGDNLFYSDKRLYSFLNKIEYNNIMETRITS